VRYVLVALYLLYVLVPLASYLAFYVVCTCTCGLGYAQNNNNLLAEAVRAIWRTSGGIGIIRSDLYHLPSSFVQAFAVSLHNMSLHIKFFAIIAFILVYGNSFFLQAGHLALKPLWLVSEIASPISCWYGLDFGGRHIGKSRFLLILKEQNSIHGISFRMQLY